MKSLWHDEWGGFQHPFNHNPHCIRILIGSVDILNCRDYDCWDFYTNPMSALHKYIWKSDGNENEKKEKISLSMTMYIHAKDK